MKTRAGFYVSTVCNLAHEARKKGWDVERIRKADQARPAQQQEHHRQRTRQSARRRAPRPTSPTPAEAGALVMELRQQPATYIEAQTQVCQREAHLQAVRQQAQIYQQLTQAAQALKTFPEGSRAWERAQREQQELERQMAALRKQTPETPTTAPEASPEGGQPPSSRQDCSERDYRDAIHAWARTRGWTVRHGPYGGSQRDWQIGLMAASKAELAQVAVELGV